MNAPGRGAPGFAGTRYAEAFAAALALVPALRERAAAPRPAGTSATC